MSDYEYALRTVAVSGQEFEIAHAVPAGTLVAVCGTVAVPLPRSRWDETAAEVRCEACERTIADHSAEAHAAPVVTTESGVLAEPAPAPLPEHEHEPEHEPAPPPEPEPAGLADPEHAPAPAAARATMGPDPAGPSTPAPRDVRPGAWDSVAAAFARAASSWRGLRMRTRAAAVVGILVVVLVVVVLLARGHGFKADPNSPAYQNGYAYGHDLMIQSADPATACTQATVDDPASSDGRNFIAGCRAGYAARTP